MFLLFSYPLYAQEFRYCLGGTDGVGCVDKNNNDGTYTCVNRIDETKSTCTCTTDCPTGSKLYEGTCVDCKKENPPPPSNLCVNGRCVCKVTCPPPCTQCGNGLNVGDTQCVGNKVYECKRDLFDGTKCTGVLKEDCDPNRVCVNTSNNTAECQATPTPTPTPGKQCNFGGVLYNPGASVCLYRQGQYDSKLTCQPDGTWKNEICYIRCIQISNNPPDATAECEVTPTPTPTPPSKCRGSWDCVNGAPCGPNQACKIILVNNSLSCRCVDCTNSNCDGIACKPGQECVIIDIPDHPSNGCVCENIPTPTPTPTPTPDTRPNCDKNLYPHLCSSGKCPTYEICVDMPGTCTCKCDPQNCGGIGGPCPDGQYCRDDGSGCHCVNCDQNNCIDGPCPSNYFCRVNPGEGTCYCREKCHCERSTYNLCSSQAQCDGECQAPQNCTWEAGTIYNDCVCK